MGSALYLRNNLYFGNISQSYIFLDARDDKYSMFQGAQSKLFSEIYENDGSAPLSTAATHFAEKLVRKGMLTRNAQGAKPIAEITYQTSTSCAFMPEADEPLMPRLRDVPTFLRALLVSRWIRNRKRSAVKDVLAIVQTWKSERKFTVAADPEIVTDLVNRFHALTPLFFTAHNECFFRSLCLIRYLSLFGLSANWVFAVRLSPFAAHCWVEHDHIILNEDLDVTRSFKPIMIV